MHSDSVDDYQMVELGIEDAHDKDLLRPPSKRHLGGEEPDVTFDKIFLRIHRKPVARNLRDLYELGNRKVPDEYEVFRAYDLWMLENTFSIFKQGGFQSIQQVEFKVVLVKPSCTVLTVLPKSEFVTHLDVGIRSLAELMLDGRCRIPEPASVLVESHTGFGVGGNMQASSSVSVVGQVSLSLISPTITAAGMGDDESRWIFERRFGGPPIFGEQTVLQVLLTPRKARRVMLEASVSAVASTWGFAPTRLQGSPVDLEVRLS